MAEVVWTKRAYSQLREIAEYIALAVSMQSGDFASENYGALVSGNPTAIQ